MSSRDKILLATFGVIAALAATWFVVVAPKRDEARQLDAQITAARTDLAGTAANAASYRAARDRLRKHPEAFKKAGTALPSRVAMPDLLRTLTRTARGTGVVLDDLTTGDGNGAGATSPGIGSVGLQLNFTGDFLALQRYLQRLQRFVAVHSRDVDAKGRLVALNTVQLSGGDDGLLKAQVSATVYVMQPDALTLAPATPAPAPGAAPSTTPAPPSAAASATTPTAGGVQ